MEKKVERMESKYGNSFAGLQKDFTSKDRSIINAIYGIVDQLFEL